MKRGYRDIDKDGNGSIALTCEEPEDMWHVYNIIQETDRLKASTIRKVVTESATGSTAANKVRTTLTLQVESIEYDTQACVLRVKGRNCVENDYVKIGQYHTLDLEVNRKFTIHKTYWDSVTLDRVNMACDVTQKADVAAIVMQEGLAHICLVTAFMTLTRAKIEVSIPRKRKGLCSQHEKGLNKFYDSIIQAISRHINFDVVKCILVASPGFVKDHFLEYMNSFAVKNDLKPFIDNKNKFIPVHSSSGFKHSLKEVLSDPLIQNRLVDTKAATEVKALEQFYELLHSDPARAFYGMKHVERANEFEAIKLLLVSDSLFRSKDLAIRKKYIKLVESAKQNRADVLMFSSLHITGEQLDQLTGVAAILRFPLPDLEDVDLSSSEDEV